jgi:hypothetical protein
MRVIWKVRPSPSAARRYVRSLVMSRPNRATLPVVGRSSPDSRLNRVVLPAPLGPMMPNRAPAATRSDTSATAVTPRNRRQR